MGVQYQRRKSLGGGAQLNLSHRGLGLSQRLGPLTVSTRGNMSLRLAPGLSYRVRGKNAGAAMAVAALTVLLVVVSWWVLKVLVLGSWWLLRASWTVAVWAVDTVSGAVQERRAAAAGRP